MDFMIFFPFLLGLLLIFIIGITFWLAWVIFKARHKKQAQNTGNTAPVAASRGAYLLAVDRAANGAWEITVNGEHYPTLEAVPDDAVRRDVVAGLKEVVGFARSYVQKEQAAKKPPAVRPRSPQVTPPQPAREPATRTVDTAAPDSQIPPAEKPAAPVAPPPVTPEVTSAAADKLRVFLKGEPTLKRSDAAPVIMTTLDLAREIGEIVAEMQARVPSLAQRSIKLQNAPSGGVCFAIDGIVYSDVNEIPDADIQALIRAATKEWERR